jgi:isopenicillin-N N-acyltransferase-like protein
VTGIAEGSGKDVLDIIALNVRTEINFGLFSDGCTSLYWRDDAHTFLGQNWDVRKPSALNSLLVY